MDIRNLLVSIVHELLILIHLQLCALLAILVIFCGTIASSRHPQVHICARITRIPSKRPAFAEMVSIVLPANEMLSFLFQCSYLHLFSITVVRPSFRLGSAALQFQKPTLLLQLFDQRIPVGPSARGRYRSSKGLHGAAPQRGLKPRR